MTFFRRVGEKLYVQSRLLFQASIVTVQSACILHLITDRIGFIQECKGESMLPTLAPQGDWIYYSRLPYYPSTSFLCAPFQRGDLVIATHPYLPDRTVGKRIIAMEGDTVEVDPGNLRAVSGKDGGKGWVRVPKGHVWLQGDNLSNSTDSRDYGPVPMALILARVEGRIWPTWTDFKNNLRWHRDYEEDT
ncbi:Mitochondrial inner membrane protease, subunit IMP1 [Phaffia rhodozyma]|uniref:Mitochondrial inner membrane protease subunit n=1 Tax=Phaffia rhodozyma TaxID=264483 RepID=A0A0F7SR53_PHARH|nr:Mitochondrial inner membrane protease, subunit IMP1 [Phaffia rhodozyma]